MATRSLRIGLTMGDPNGVGPEIALKALEQHGRGRGGATPDLVMIGASQSIAETAERLGLQAKIVPDGQPKHWPLVGVVEAGSAREPVAFGRVTTEAGRLAYLAIARAVELAMRGDLDAIVTAPISKEALNEAGYPHLGHTDLLAKLTGSRDSCMMLSHDKLYVTHVTSHVSIADVPRCVTPERVHRVIELTLQAMHDLGIHRPRVAVCGLNPHSGEAGLLGHEDRDVLAPAIAAFADRGDAVSGPHPGDTIFVKAVAGQFDAVVAMFHDQGHIPVKLLGFSIDPESGRWTQLSGVNSTLGLPIIRTSVDHGTAFDIAGQGIANPQSMVEAIAFAQRLALARPASPVAVAGE